LEHLHRRGARRPGTANPAETTGRLLAGPPELTGSDPVRIDSADGGVIDVPDRFTAAEMTAAAAAVGKDGKGEETLAGRVLSGGRSGPG
jgi:hypothetical protein